MDKVTHPASRCPACNKPVALEHRQLRRRLYICPRLARGWRFAVDGRNRLVVMAIARVCDKGRAVAIIEESEAKGHVSDGPGEQVCTLDTPLLNVAKPQTGLIYMPAKKRPRRIIGPN